MSKEKTLDSVDLQEWKKWRNSRMHKYLKNGEKPTTKDLMIGSGRTLASIEKLCEGDPSAADIEVLLESCREQISNLLDYEQNQGKIFDWQEEFNKYWNSPVKPFGYFPQSNA